MGILKRLLSGVSSQPDHWPNNNTRYSCWKPASVLPAPKWAVKRAIKLCYAEWPEPIDWGVFSPFFMEFADLALHLPQEQYDTIESFRKRRITCGGKETEHDPLLMFRLNSGLATAYAMEQCNQDIIRIRDGLRRSVAWDPVGVNDYELDAVRRILLESTVEYASLIQEWRFYILSIGRDQFIENP
jgi:hypothetical protein